MKRTHNFPVRLSDEENAHLVDIVDSTGLRKSDVIRQALRRWADELKRNPFVETTGAASNESE